MNLNIVAFMQISFLVLIPTDQIKYHFLVCDFNYFLLETLNIDDNTELTSISTICNKHIFSSLNRFDFSTTHFHFFTWTIYHQTLQ